MSKYTREYVIEALLDYNRRRNSRTAAHDLLKQVCGAQCRFSEIQESMFDAVIAACAAGPDSAITGRLGGTLRMTASADDPPHEQIDPFQQAGKANNDAAQKFWDDKLAAQAAGEPVPDLPEDQHNKAVFEKLVADREAAKSIGAGHWDKK